VRRDRAANTTAIQVASRSGGAESLPDGVMLAGWVPATAQARILAVQTVLGLWTGRVLASRDFAADGCPVHSTPRSCREESEAAHSGASGEFAVGMPARAGGMRVTQRHVTQSRTGAIARDQAYGGTLLEPWLVQPPALLGPPRRMTGTTMGTTALDRPLRPTSDLRRQVLTSRHKHLRSDPVGAVRQVEAQIEHHPFPSMPRRFRALVNDYSAGEGVAYAETTVGSSCVHVLRYLDSVR
jgi:hypothetical protein